MSQYHALAKDVFDGWVAASRHGESYLYYTGLLMADRASSAPGQPPTQEAALADAIGAAAMDAARRGHVVLLQERVGPLVCKYYAVRVVK